MPRKPSILRRAGIRLPETARAAFAKLPAAEQRAAAQRDVAHFLRGLRKLDRERRRLERGVSARALLARLELVELELAWVLSHLGVDREWLDAEGADLG